MISAAASLHSRRALALAAVMIKASKGGKEKMRT